MNIKIIQDRIDNYSPQNQLSSLSRQGFFKVGVFLGGTCLRIFYGLNRFSEDMDFALKKVNPKFDWSPYLNSLQNDFTAYGYQLQIQDRSTLKSPVKTVFLKDNSIGKILILKHKKNTTPKSIKIKLEIDTNPPLGATYEQKYIDFPVTVPVLSHDLPSLFAGKSHALLCRNWEKGRDWFDFIWYTGRKVAINFDLLSNAIDQSGPWKGKGIKLNKNWYTEKMQEKILTTDWENQKKDMARFVKQKDLDLMDSWNSAFFLSRLEIMQEHVQQHNIT
ncbi:MAG: nucleotidyl transferase AbiEii/AbiGii toxin family protein [Deltaproteobacteria bacterium]|nr:nucleotidyl transferase AbiEii/AbiGii toxin family protein [Deltaproteobacteria bacterium]